MSADVVDANEFGNSALKRVEDGIDAALKRFGVPFSVRDPGAWVPFEGLVSWVRGHLRDGGRQKTLSRPTIQNNIEDLAGGNIHGPFAHIPDGLPFEVRFRNGVVGVMRRPPGRKRKQKRDTGAMPSGNLLYDSLEGLPL